jgi:tetratricopeptide (TPR) repeat protein
LQITAALLTADPALTAASLADDLVAAAGRLDLLAYDDGSGASAPSVAAAFELSYRRLDQQAARMFRLLAINPGPDISTAAAAALAGLPAAQTRTVLAALARAHLAETAPGAAGRWRMHDLVALYAARVCKQHASAGDRDQARDRLLGYYQATAKVADDHLRALPTTPVPGIFAGRDQALAWLDAERPGLIAAVAMAAATGCDYPAMNLPLILGEYLGWRRRFEDWITITNTSIQAARRLGDRHGEGNALNNLGVALRQMRRFDEAITAGWRAAAIYRDTRDRHGQGTALDNLGSALQEVRRFDDAITAYQDAAAIYRDTGDRYGEGTALGNLGTALQGVLRFDEAITAHQEDLAICRDTGDRHGEGTALNNLGFALLQVRRFDDAITARQDAAAICRDTGDRHGEGTALEGVGLALHAAGRFGEAITAYQEAIAIYQQTGDTYREDITRNHLERARTQLSGTRGTGAGRLRRPRTRQSARRCWGEWPARPACRGRGAVVGRAAAP